MWFLAICKHAYHRAPFVACSLMDEKCLRMLLLDCRKRLWRKNGCQSTTPMRWGWSIFWTRMVMTWSIWRSLERLQSCFPRHRSSHILFDSNENCASAWSVCVLKLLGRKVYYWTLVEDENVLSLLSPFPRLQIVHASIAHALCSTLCRSVIVAS